MTSGRRRSTRAQFGSGHTNVGQFYRRGNVWVRTKPRQLLLNTTVDPSQPTQPTQPTQPPPTDPKPFISTRFGACPGPGHTNAEVVAKYGPKTFLRNFGGTPGNTLTKTLGSSGCHYSWKIGIEMTIPKGSTKAAVLATNNAILQDIINGVYDARIKTSVTPLDPTYWSVEFCHEGDRKYNGGWVSLSLLQQAKNHFYDVVKSVNPKLLVANTLTGYAFSPNNSLYTSGLTDSRYGVIKADLIGLDVDGIHSFPYPDMKTRAPNAQKFIKAHAAYGYTGYCFPEWGTTTTQPQDQPDLLIMANDWITYYGESWKAQPIPPVFAAWYDYPNNPETPTSTANDELTQPAVINAMRDLVEGSVALAA